MKKTYLRRIRNWKGIAEGIGKGSIGLTLGHKTEIEYIAVCDEHIRKSPLRECLKEKIRFILAECFGFKLPWNYHGYDLDKKYARHSPLNEPVEFFNLYISQIYYIYENILKMGRNENPSPLAGEGRVLRTRVRGFITEKNIRKIEENRLISDIAKSGLKRIAEKSRQAHGEIKRLLSLLGEREGLVDEIDRDVIIDDKLRTQIDNFMTGVGRVAQAILDADFKKMENWI